MDKAITKIIIVGGGTAGWLSALYLTTFLNYKSDPAKPKCKISLIESSDIPSVGVGEATIQNIRDTFQALDLDETEWMTKCNATFKMAVKFVNWAGNNDVFWHPFSGLPEINGIDLYHYLIEKKLNQDSNFDLKNSLIHLSLYLDQKSPKLGIEKDYESPIDYGYHLDAGLLAIYLKEKAISRGVEHIIAQVKDAKLNNQGLIQSLILDNSQEIEAELFIDCSGFQGYLINQVLNEPFDSYKDSLPCDRAVAISIASNDEKEGINPYTTATAMNSGWSWHTPLFGRSGNGYVYSSQYLKPEEAEQELRDFLGEKFYDSPAKHLQMRVGKTRNTWVKNCISIGLSSGFVEPLESTGIYLIEVGLKTLLNYFPDCSFNSFFRDQYNHIMTQYYEEIRDFIVLHYCLSPREDTSFWKSNKYQKYIPDSLKEKLSYFRFMPPNKDEFEPNLLFSEFSYFCILSGKHHLPEKSLPIFNYLDTKEADSALAKLNNETQEIRSILPSHYEYLKELHQGSIKNYKQLFRNYSRVISTAINY